MSAHDLEALHDAATDLYGSDEIQIDIQSEEDVSEGEAGTWVRAWVLIPKEETVE